MYAQRAAEPPAPEDRDRGRSWLPPGMPLEVAGFEIEPNDRYVAVDRIDDGLATLSVAPWPTVDPETGRLSFGRSADRETRTVGAERLRQRALAVREDAELPDRPIRVGDVFLVRGLKGLPARWELVVDVTRPARLAAKAALLSTVAPAPPVEDLGAFGVDDPRPDDTRPRAPAAEPDEAASAPPGPVAFPAV